MKATQNQVRERAQDNEVVQATRKEEPGNHWSTVGGGELQGPEMAEEMFSVVCAQHTERELGAIGKCEKEARGGARGPQVARGSTVARGQGLIATRPKALPSAKKREGVGKNQS